MLAINPLTLEVEKEKYKKTLLVVKTTYFETFAATEVTELNRIESNWADFEGVKKWAKNQQIESQRDTYRGYRGRKTNTKIKNVLIN